MVSPKSSKFAKKNDKGQDELDPERVLMISKSPNNRNTLTALE
jgi:hypothetical protein